MVQWLDRFTLSGPWCLLHRPIWPAFPINHSNVMSDSASALFWRVFPSAFEAICLLRSWSFMSGNASLKENLRRCLGLVLLLPLWVMVVLGMCEGWEEVQRKNLRSLFNSSTWTTALWKMKICPSAPTANTWCDGSQHGDLHHIKAVESDSTSRAESRGSSRGCTPC